MKRVHFEKDERVFIFLRWNSFIFILKKCNEKHPLSHLAIQLFLRYSSPTNMNYFRIFSHPFLKPKPRSLTQLGFMCFVLLFGILHSSPSCYANPPLFYVHTTLKSSVTNREKLGDTNSQSGSISNDAVYKQIINELNELGFHLNRLTVIAIDIQHNTFHRSEKRLAKGAKFGKPKYYTEWELKRNFTAGVHFFYQNPLPANIENEKKIFISEEVKNAKFHFYESSVTGKPIQVHETSIIDSKDFAINLLNGNLGLTQKTAIQMRHSFFNYATNHAIEPWNMHTQLYLDINENPTPILVDDSSQFITGTPIQTLLSHAHLKDFWTAGPLVRRIQKLFKKECNVALNDTKAIEQNNDIKTLNTNYNNQHQ